MNYSAVGEFLQLGDGAFQNVDQSELGCLLSVQSFYAQPMFPFHVPDPVQQTTDSHGLHS